MQQDESVVSYNATRKVFTFDLTGKALPVKLDRPPGAPASAAVPTSEWDNEAGPMRRTCEVAAVKGIVPQWFGVPAVITEEPGEGVKVVVKHPGLPGGQAEL